MNHTHFSEWLKERDTHLYSEINWRKLAAKVALFGSMLIPPAVGVTTSFMQPKEKPPVVQQVEPGVFHVSVDAKDEEDAMKKIHQRLTYGTVGHRRNMQVVPVEEPHVERHDDGITVTGTFRVSR